MISSESFYQFSNNSAYTRGFTWAISIVPKSDIHHQECGECGAVEHYPLGAIDIIVEEGSKYPDILGCGAYPFLIVSQKAIEAWKKSAITSFHTYPVGIAEVKSKKLRDVEQPQYVRVEIDGKCKIDLTTSGGNLIRICPECQRVIEQSTMDDEGSYSMKPNSWDGSPLFRDPILYPRISFCTKRILEVATEHQLTNFRFGPMEGPFDSANKGISYMR